MPTILKVAQTAKELDDVFWLRHEVYVIEDGKFGGKPLIHQRIIDHFDALPSTASIIAYDDDEPVGTIRVTFDTEIGLPPDAHYHFDAYRESEAVAWRETHDMPAIFAASGMLAIRGKWRRRRDIILALLKMATGVLAGWNVTHVIVTSNHETTSLYEHLGFEALAEKYWVEEIGNYIVPMATAFSRIYNWAFSELLSNNLDTFWLDNFAQHFERVLVSSQTVLFREHDDANEAYILDSGWISVSRKDSEGRELTLAMLSRGSLFGELALLDSQPRSATVITNTNTELIRLDKKSFNAVLGISTPITEKLFSVFAERIRRTDDLAMVLAFAPQTERVKYALDDLRRNSIPDKRNPGATIIKIGPKELAKSAGVREHEVQRVLEIEKFKGLIDYGEKYIRFTKLYQS